MRKKLVEALWSEIRQHDDKSWPLAVFFWGCSTIDCENELIESPWTVLMCFISYIDTFNSVHFYEKKNPTLFIISIH